MASTYAILERPWSLMSVPCRPCTSHLSSRSTTIVSPKSILLLTFGLPFFTAVFCQCSATSSASALDTSPLLWSTLRCHLREIEMRGDLKVQHLMISVMPSEGDHTVGPDPSAGLLPSQDPVLSREREPIYPSGSSLYVISIVVLCRRFSKSWHVINYHCDRYHTVNDLPPKYTTFAASRQCLL